MHTSDGQTSKKRQGQRQKAAVLEEQVAREDATTACPYATIKEHIDTMRTWIDSQGFQDLRSYCQRLTVGMDYFAFISEKELYTEAFAVADKHSYFFENEYKPLLEVEVIGYKKDDIARDESLERAMERIDGEVAHAKRRFKSLEAQELDHRRVMKTVEQAVTMLCPLIERKIPLTHEKEIHQTYGQIRPYVQALERVVEQYAGDPFYKSLVTSARLAIEAAKQTSASEIRQIQAKLAAIAAKDRSDTYGFTGVYLETVEDLHRFAFGERP